MFFHVSLRDFLEETSLGKSCTDIEPLVHGLYLTLQLEKSCPDCFANVLFLYVFFHVDLKLSSVQSKGYTGNIENVSLLNVSSYGASECFLIENIVRTGHTRMVFSHCVYFYVP